MVQIEPILDHNKDVVYFLHHSFIGNQQLPSCSPLLHSLLFYFFETILYFVFQFRDMNYHYTPSQIVRYFIIAMYNPVSSANHLPGIVKFEIFVIFQYSIYCFTSYLQNSLSSLLCLYIRNILLKYLCFVLEITINLDYRL